MKAFIETIAPVIFISGLNLQTFVNHVNVTTDADLSPEMKTFYDMRLIDEASAALVHSQFAQKRPIPKNGGKTIEFRKFAKLPKALTPLTEGVTPDGKTLKVTAITATVAQYGDYITQSDVLELTSIDNTIVEATKILGQQAGLTLDTITRNVLQSGTNVSYASAWSGTTETEITSRADLDETCKLKVDTVERIVAKLRAVNAPTISGDYVAIVHPYVAYDLRRDPDWIDAHKYAQPDELYNGEIGKIAGVRFVTSSEAKIYRDADLTEGSRNLTVKTAISSSTTTVAVKELITAADATALAGRKISDGTNVYTIASASAAAAGSATLTLSAAISSLAANTVLVPAESNKKGLSVFGCLFMGADAYGETEVTGGGLTTIIKQKGSAGTADPLDQRSSIGWKAIKTAEILIPDYLVRVECTSRYSNTAEEN